MIGLVRLSPPAGNGVGTRTLDALPRPPAWRYSAFAVCCDDGAHARETTEWYRSLFERRPAVPLGLVARGADCVQALARLDQSLSFLLIPDDAPGGLLPAAALDQLREHAVEGRIFDEVVQAHGRAVLAQEPTLRALLAHAVRGGTIVGAGKHLGVHAETVTRRLNKVGLSASLVAREARLRAFDLRVEMGADRGSALRACGWLDPEHRRKAAARLRESEG